MQAGFRTFDAWLSDDFEMMTKQSERVSNFCGFFQGTYQIICPI